jgi:hypothetical protein
MPGTTTTQGLIYPVKTDRLRELPAQQRSLAFQLENRWNSPAVAVAATVAQTLTMTGGPPDADTIRWDTVLFDTAGFADLATDTRGIDTSGVGGYFSVGVWVSHGTIGGSQPVTTLSLETASPPSMTNSIWDNSPGVAQTTFGQSVVGIDLRDLEEDILYARLAGSGSGIASTITVHEAVMWAFWERDL